MAGRKIKIIRSAHPAHVQFGRRVIDIPMPPGLPEYDALVEEFLGYANVLAGHEDAPINSPYLQLMEVATAYYARACEVEMLILEGEHTDAIIKGSEFYKFRTGHLRTFKEMAKLCADLGSRRLTQEQLLTAQRYDAGDR